MPVIEKWVSDGKLKLPNKKIAFISSDNPYSRSISDGMQADAKAARLAGHRFGDRPLRRDQRLACVPLESASGFSRGDRQHRLSAGQCGDLQ